MSQRPVHKNVAMILGWLGVVCLTFCFVIKLYPEIADTFFLSVPGKFTVLGIFVASALFPAIPAISGSKWWLVALGAGAANLADFLIVAFRMRY